jgi:hypothetical protein
MPEYMEDSTKLTESQKIFKKNVKECIHSLAFGSKEYRKSQLREDYYHVGELYKKVRKEFNHNHIKLEWGRLSRAQYKIVESVVKFNIDDFKNNIGTLNKYESVPVIPQLRSNVNNQSSEIYDAHKEFIKLFKQNNENPEFT